MFTHTHSYVCYSQCTARSNSSIGLRVGEHIRTLHNSCCTLEKQVSTLALSHFPVSRQSRTALTPWVNSGCASQGHCKEAIPPGAVLGHVQVMPDCITTTLSQYTAAHNQNKWKGQYYLTLQHITIEHICKNISSKHDSSIGSYSSLTLSPAVSRVRLLAHHHAHHLTWLIDRFISGCCIDANKHTIYRWEHTNSL